MSAYIGRPIYAPASTAVLSFVRLNSEDDYLLKISKLSAIVLIFYKIFIFDSGVDPERM